MSVLVNCVEKVYVGMILYAQKLLSTLECINDGSVRGVGKFDPAKHYYRPIPQIFLNSITNANGVSLSDDEKQAMQNPGY